MDGLKAWVRELGSKSRSVSLAVITFYTFSRSSAGSHSVNASPGETLKKAKLRQLLKS